MHGQPNRMRRAQQESTLHTSGVRECHSVCVGVCVCVCFPHVCCPEICWRGAGDASWGFAVWRSVRLARCNQGRWERVNVSYSQMSYLVNSCFVFLFCFF